MAALHALAIWPGQGISEMFRWFVLLGTHAAMLVFGFALGVYTLPILTAPKGPDKVELAAASKTALFKGQFSRKLKGSDFLHWGEGEVRVGRTMVAHEGRLAPGPDYKLYLVPEFVETEEAFEKVRAKSRQIGDVKSFNGFIVNVPPDVDITKYNTVVVWCESFSEFISAAKYR